MPCEVLYVILTRFILIHQTYRIALTWHCFVEFMKNMPCGNSLLMLCKTVSMVSSLRPDVGRGFLQVSNVFLSTRAGKSALVPSDIWHNNIVLNDIHFLHHHFWWRLPDFSVGPQRVKWIEYQLSIYHSNMGSIFHTVCYYVVNDIWWCWNYLNWDMFNPMTYV